jgi:hypothetical protein
MIVGVVHTVVVIRPKVASDVLLPADAPGVDVVVPEVAVLVHEVVSARASFHRIEGPKLRKDRRKFDALQGWGVSNHDDTVRLLDHAGQEPQLSGLQVSVVRVGLEDVVKVHVGNMPDGREVKVDRTVLEQPLNLPVYIARDLSVRWSLRERPATS